MKQQTMMQPKKCIFYFKYQMKIEFIPYIEQQIQQFVDLCERKVYDPQSRQQIFVVLKKRIQQIDTFFQKHWNDYRIQQILRGRKMLVGITQKYHHLFALSQDKDHKQDTKQSISMYVQAQERSKSRQNSKNPITDRSNKKKITSAVNRSHERENKNSGKGSHNLHPSSKGQSFQATPQTIKQIRNPPRTEVRSKSKRMQSTENNLNAKVKSAKQLPKMSPVRKMTKQEYIAHLRNKKNKN